jgi:DNA-binding transcriptional ArsR family regulator
MPPLRVRSAPMQLFHDATRTDHRGRGNPDVQVLMGKYLLAYAGGVGDVFKALADPTRRKILDELADRDGQTLFEICNRLVMRYQISSSRQAISQHLDLLEAAGLVHTRRDGRYKFHYLDTAPLDRIGERWRPKEER